MIISSIKPLASTFARLPARAKLAVFAACFLVGVLLASFGGMIGYRVSRARYSKREAARMKQVQAALASAEAAERRAEAKEAQAELLARQNAARAKTTTAESARLEQEAKTNDAKITADYAADVNRINSLQSDCERCRDSCARLDRAASRNPALAEFRCSATACEEACPAP